MSPLLNAATPSPSGLVRYAAAIVALGLATAAGLIYADWVTRQKAAQPQPAAIASCPQPSELEQMHIVVTRRGDKLVAECMFVGPRGAYHRSRHGMPQPRP